MLGNRLNALINVFITQFNVRIINKMGFTFEFTLIIVDTKIVQADTLLNFVYYFLYKIILTFCLLQHILSSQTVAFKGENK